MCVQGSSEWRGGPPQYSDGSPGRCHQLPMGASLPYQRPLIRPRPIVLRLTERPHVVASSPAYSRAKQTRHGRLEALSVPSHVAPISLALCQKAITSLALASADLEGSKCPSHRPKKQSPSPHSSRKGSALPTETVLTLNPRHRHQALTHLVPRLEIRDKPHTDDAQHLSRRHGFMVAPLAH